MGCGFTFDIWNNAKIDFKTNVKTVDWRDTFEFDPYVDVKLDEIGI